ncbi:hypothetical protein K450DRAFT_187884 [Umbelopsis ramanniana AG]|uniref:Paladin n=1 Tax=Umbelopsis ramanniana AG TaxID=1314678 RepID=A0AAD5HFE3_UMBRA|nr:uncharacterized protein K450DRAFT_187884 [Umbelopsis ramanniana AG]KAI8579918.1 hypothetical protein K450DRAFT_187884 [Umbelopsis ramanniana AG]
MATSPPDHNKSVLPMVQSPPSYQVQRKGSLPTNRKTQRSNSRTNSDQAQTQRSPFIPSRIASVHSQPTQRSLSTDDGYANHTLVAKPFTAQHDPKRLLNVVTSVVKTRSGSVLSRNTILKMDHFPSGAHSNLDFHLQGAPNFRMVDLNVYGVAQPTVIGLSTILALLNCHPKSHGKAQCAWFSTREEPLVYLNGTPYVLREYTKPLQNIRAYYGMNSQRLEKMEERLKADVVKETAKFGGLVLVHQELLDGTVVPCWLSADSIQTPKEVFQKFQEQNYRLQYFRIPICPDQSPGDNYLDEYVRIIKTLEPTDPLIFNCGMGVVRTTVGMIVAQIIRRTQLIERGMPDPFPIIGWQYSHAVDGDVDAAVPMAPELVKGLEEAAEKNSQTRALLRLVYVLEKGLDSKMSPHSAIEWALARGQSIDALRQAIMGNYTSIVALSSTLESGSYSKKLLDEIIDRSDAVVNLREDILMNRIRQTTVSSNQQEYDPNNNEYLAKALAGLERYFFLLIFTSYINESEDTGFAMRFSDWVKGRSEIWSMMQKLRRKGPQLYLFRPVEDLSALGNGRDNRSRANNSSSFGHNTGMFGMTDQNESRVAGEVEGYALKARSGSVLTSHTILKVDFWQSQWVPQEEQHQSALFSPMASPNVQLDGFIERHQLATGYDGFMIEGASNFRRIPHTAVHAVAQPTIEGLKVLLRKMRRDRGQGETILWINLREEPIIYINGIPYVLRDRYFTLRNIRAYSGITSSRLEMLEQRLKEDVITETLNYDGRILLHGEDSDGNVRAVWEDVHVDDILTVKDVMELVVEDVSNDSDSDSVSKGDMAIKFMYYRVPVTAEKPPEWKDFDDMRNLIASAEHPDNSIVLNCQVGLGRSTTGTVIATLLTSWIYPGISTQKAEDVDHEVSQRPRLNYQLINSLLRVIKNGLEVKSVVDDAIDRCGRFLNLRDVIEDMHVQAENETDEALKKRTIKKGITALERYFLLICFQSYLDQTSPEAVGDTETFETWMKRHPELSTILLETRKDDIELIVPVESSIGDGLALESEVTGVVSSRHGQVLAQQTILKHDAFPGCQKMSLREKVDGAPNYRRVEAKGIKAAVKYSNLRSSTSGLQHDMELDDFSSLSPPYICGCAMPTKDAIKKVLAKMDAGPGGKRKVLWTCLREEPVLYVNKRPYVLRLSHDPLKNLETTGIAKERVEGMENRMKSDVLEELKVYNGRLLLHDEETTEKGGFIILPQWETVPVEMVETPGDVFKSIIEEGYQVDYLRIPITDEQAPIPDVFDQLIRRMQNANTGVDVLFNCQMGRGRTTTGMVTACLMTMILKNDLVMDMTSSYVVESSTTPLASTADLGELSLYNLDEDEAHQAAERYTNGEYKIILQLVSALTYGKLAKRLTDHAINECDHMQNLRKAIYDYKLRLDALEVGSQKYHATREVGLNYLVRYFYLIVFANYLLEEMVHQDDGSSDDGDHDTNEETILDDEAKKIITFSQWLKGRREITNIIKLNSIDFE